MRWRGLGHQGVAVVEAEITAAGDRWVKFNNVSTVISGQQYHKLQMHVVHNVAPNEFQSAMASRVLMV